jgi:hypothetical protein
MGLRKMAGMIWSRTFDVWSSRAWSGVFSQAWRTKPALRTAFVERFEREKGYISSTYLESRGTAFGLGFP